jgi:hypothetical protein
VRPAIRGSSAFVAAPMVGLVDAADAADPTEPPDGQIAAAGSTTATVASAPPRWLSWTLWVTFVLAVMYALWASTIGWHNTLYSDLHQFRQSQTAITCFYMLRDGLTLNYQTPILGPNWQVPLEFPLYQWIVVTAVKVLGSGLDVTGRGVSLLFFFLTLIPVYIALPALNVRGAYRLIFLILLLISPFYIFWSRTFMIETTALALGVGYSACVILYVWKRSRGGASLRATAYLLVLAVVFGSLAALVKITTFVSLALAPALYVAKDYITWPLPNIRWRVVARQVVLPAVCGGVPLAVAIQWTHHADAIKNAEPIAHWQSSTSPNMVSWIWGTASEKFSLDTWKRLLLEPDRTGSLIALDAAFWLACLVVPIVTRRRWKEVLACVLLFVATPAIFTKVHWVHDYYMCANGIFLLMAVGFCILAIFETSHRARAAALASLGVTMAVAALGFRSVYYPLQVSHPQSHRFYADMINFVSQTADKDPDSVIVYIGLDWDSTLPYYTRHRALMIPNWEYGNLTRDDVIGALSRLKGYKIGGIYAIPTQRPTQPWNSPDWVIERMRDLRLDTRNVQWFDLVMTPNGPSLTLRRNP